MPTPNSDNPLLSLDPKDYSLFEDVERSFQEEDHPIDWDEYIFEAVNQLADEEIPAAHIISKRRQASSSQWYPFKSKEYLIASLMLGYLHHIMSREVYAQLRLILNLTGLQLPHWTTLRKSRENIRQMLQLELRHQVSVWGRQCYSLSAAQIVAHELSNPYVNLYLDFYPEETHGLNVNKFSQSHKWLKCLSPNLRVPMVAVGNKHFYIFEPTKLGSGQIIVPIFFYQEGGEIWAKCVLQPTFVITSNPERWTITIPTELSFDSEALTPIKVSEFDLVYSEIQMRNGVFLSQLCSNELCENTIPPSCHTLPNPWRIKAKGRQIRHVPINLYADDTSGNMSKQWNRDYSFYFTLSGLPPKAANLEYNCHFLSTSNEAGMLELADQIVDELNVMATEGFAAYDSRLDQEVLAMSMVLCFQGDLPVHAEVTNTPMPNVSLNPCRMCTLHTTKLQLKKGKPYIQDFLHINSAGEHSPVEPRTWEGIQSQTEELWRISKMGVKARFDEATKEFGVRDGVNREFAAAMMADKDKGLIDQAKALDECESPRLFNPFLRLAGFDGSKDTPVEVLHSFLLGVVKYHTRDFMNTLKPANMTRLEACWKSFNTRSLNITSIQPHYLRLHFKSLVGKDFKIILQTAPFVFFQFMDDTRRRLWTSMCQLGNLMFETRISNMDGYLSELKKHIDIFLWHCIQMNAQWVNKPKFHMLLHLPESIPRFGPASLFATEKFESYNSVLRMASIHSNGQRPGRDLAISFINFHALRLVLSNARLHNHRTGIHFHASDEVVDIFEKNASVQQSMGYRDFLTSSSGNFPSIMATPLPPEEEEDTPLSFAWYSNAKIRQVSQLRLSEKDVIRKGYFVLIISPRNPTNHIIARIHSIWQISHQHHSQFKVQVTRFEPSVVSAFYQMRSLINCNEVLYFNVLEIKACINVQHDCDSGECPMIETCHSNRNGHEGCENSNG
ncbi:hypothetical protein PCASD_18574 [Puccinia coronata f. sp. avenae]|uniref:Uncharacterized protein n=1 Tax=Puccinia coronata f. sp. avenae TaxID=200324 RepID=A0A2N5TT34_9BASI|nr:hypothetical protein PCASD_18574 [Puccinia coronata f. sp. avenae]